MNGGETEKFWIKDIKENQICYSSDLIFKPRSWKPICVVATTVNCIELVGHKPVMSCTDHVIYNIIN